MKLPEYSLKKAVSFRIQGSMDSIDFPSGTLVFPFWNEDNLPSERKQELKEASRHRDPKASPFIMCLIGKHWIPVEKDNIRSSQ